MPASRRVALVTGCERDIETAIDRRLSVAGLDTVVHEITAVGVAEPAAEVSPGPRLTRADADAIISSLEAERGPVTILVVTIGPIRQALSRQSNQWWWTVRAALWAPFVLIQAAVAGMRRAGGGSIVVVIPQGVTDGPSPSVGGICAGAGTALTRALARELAPDGIRVNAVLPFLEARARKEDPTPDLRFSAEEPPIHPSLVVELADSVAFLVSERASAFVGQILRPNTVTPATQHGVVE